jgi:urease accessory protein
MTAFIDGLTQFFVPTHLLAIVALGLLAGQHARLPVAPLAAFAIGLTVGSIAVASAIRDNPATLGLLTIAATAAGFVVMAYVVPGWLAGLMALAAGSALPLHSPPHEITIANAIASQVGLAVAALAIFVFVMLIAMYATRPWQRIGLRIVASWIAASAILVLALRLAR